MPAQARIVPAAPNGRWLVPVTDPVLRDQVEAFICARFAATYGARLHRFLPELMAMMGAERQVLAALGMTPGGAPGNGQPAAAFYLEQYLPAPVEIYLASRVGVPVLREQIMEIGNLAATTQGCARQLILSLAPWLYHRGYRWVVMTLTPALQNSFERLGLSLISLAEADPRLLKDQRNHWGQYYRHHPRVVAGYLPGALAAMERDPWLRRLLQRVPPVIEENQK